MTAIDPRAALVGALGDKVSFDVPIGSKTTYGVGGAAAMYVDAAGAADLWVVADIARSTATEVFVFGRGSNTLVADEGFDGIVVSVESIDHIRIDGSSVSAGGGVMLPVLARTTARHGLTGLEWAVGVPGTVGGGVRMNAGGHGSDVAASLISVEIFDLETGLADRRGPQDLGLRFRGSALRDHEVVITADFSVAFGESAIAEAELREVVRWRREHQPGGQNAGSVFVNPIPDQLSAGQVIDELGLRGHRLGTAEVSNKHANFIQADEGGRAADVFALMSFVRAEVLARRGIALRSENRLLGFGPVPWAGEQHHE